MRFGILIVFGAMHVYGMIEMKNLRCTSLDKSFCTFDYCFLKGINRTYKYLSLKLKLLKVPVTNISVRVEIKKQNSGVTQFDFDGCQFMEAKNNPLIGYFYSFMLPYTNINHSCPYSHDLVMEKLDISYMNSNKLSNMLPFPNGQYGMYTTWLVNNIPRVTVNAFAKLKH